jgi:cellulose synthase/poly-beta-1,6-N-acetylglucosamine synthase-like glycosyltransferase
MDATDSFENPASLAEQISEAERGIRAGFYTALISMAITLVFTILGATGTADMGFGTDWLLLIDVGLIGAFAIGMWFKSRIAATLMFIYFLISKILMLMAGQYGGIFLSLVFLYFYGRAMISSFRYHNLVKKGAKAADVF